MDEKEVFANKYWRINRFMLKMAGLWPYQKRSIKICIRTFILFAVHTMMIPQIIRTFGEWGKNSEIVIENISGFFYFQAVIAKYVTNFYAESKLQYLYERITQDWKDLSDEGEKKVLRHFANQGRFLSIGYTVYLFVAGIGFATLPALIPAFLDLIIPLNASRQKVLCFYGEYFIDQRVYYYQLLMHTFVCVMFTIMIFTTIDAAYACCVQHVIGLFNIVEFVELLQTTYTTCFFLTIGVTLICLSLGTVDVMMSMNNYVNFVRVFFAWCGVVLYLFYISMPGQKIIDASSDIFNSIYFCGWYDFPLKTQRLLNFMMMRCSVPCQFTAGPLLVLNLQNCGVILKTALSYCTFVAAMS